MNAKIINEYVYPDLENFYEFELNNKKLYAWLGEEPLSIGQKFIDLFEKLLLKEEQIKYLKKRVLKKPINVNIFGFSLNADINELNTSTIKYIKNLKIGVEVEFNLLINEIKDDFTSLKIISNYKNIKLIISTPKRKAPENIKKGDYIKGIGNLSIIINDFKEK